MNEGTSGASDEDRSRLAEALVQMDEARFNGEGTPDGLAASLDPSLRVAFKEAAEILQLLDGGRSRGADATIVDEEAGNPDRPQTRDEPGSPVGPRRFGRFEVLSKLGEGGFGIVFLARDPAVKRLVALKVPRPEVLVRQTARERFIREAHAAGKLDHPNINPVYEAGIVGAVNYIASAYCGGPTLAEWLDEHRDEAIPPRDAARIVLALGRGVQHAHERGVLHRDLKPSNVLLQKAPAPAGGSGSIDETLAGFIPRLTDFSLARIADEDDTRTASGIPMGSACYMAPEQAQGKSSAMGPATDVYGLGCVLYELLTGQPPFHGKSQVEILRRRLESEDPPSPRKNRSEVPPALDWIARHCLENGPSRRYPTAEELAEDLERFLQGGPVKARRPVMIAHAARSAWRYRYTTAAMVLLSFGYAWTHSSRNQGNATQNPAILRANVSHEKEKVRREMEKERRLTYVKLLNHAVKTLGSEDAKSVEKTFFRDPKILENRDFAWSFLEKQYHPDPVAVVRHEGPAYGLAFSPDGKTLASSGRDGAVKLTEVATGKPIRSFRAFPSDVNGVSFSSDGKTLIATGDGPTIKLWNVAAGKEIAAFEAHRPDVLGAIFNPDGKSIVSCGRHDKTVRVWDRRSFRELSSYHVGDQELENAAISPKGDLVLTVGFGSQVHLTDLARGTSKLFYAHPPDAKQIEAIAFSHDGGKLATGDTRGRITLADAISGQALATNFAGYEAITSLAFTPDDQALISSGSCGTIRLWDAASGRSLGIELGHHEKVWRIAVSPDGARVASAGQDGAVKLWDVETLRSWTGLRRLSRPLCFLPDGQLVLYDSSNDNFHSLVKYSDIQSQNRFQETRRVPMNGVHAVAALGGTRGCFVYGHRFKEIEVWDLDSLEPRTILRSKPDAGDSRPQAGDIHWLVIDEKGKWLAAIGNGCGLSRWDLERGGEVKELKLNTGSLTAAIPGSAPPRSIEVDLKDANFTVTAVSVDGDVLFSSHSRDVPSKNRTFLWIPDRSELLLVGNNLFSNECTVRGKLISDHETGIIRYWDGKTLDFDRVVFQGYPGMVIDCSLSPDGKILAVGDRMGDVNLWDVLTQRELMTLGRLGGQISRVIFSPDGAAMAASYMSETGMFSINRPQPTIRFNR